MILLRKEMTMKDYRFYPSLIPTDAASAEALRALPDGTVVAVEAKRARSPDHHRKFFALLKVAFDNQQTDFRSIDTMLDAIKIAVGHAEMRETFTGEKYWYPKSISFHNMGQQKFNEFYDKALDVICEHIMPGTDRETLENELRTAA